MLIMYKTWGEETFRNIVITMIRGLKRLNLLKDESIEEICTLKSLCEHECIRPTIQLELKNLFNIY
jgi:hypothetical protein